jgi:hypothetical protein
VGVLWFWPRDAPGINNTDASAAPLSKRKTETLKHKLVMVLPLEIVFFLNGTIGVMHCGSMLTTPPTSNLRKLSLGERLLPIDYRGIFDYSAARG